MRRTSFLLLFLLIGCGKATISDDDAGDGDGDGDCGGTCTSEQVCISDNCEDLDTVAVPAYAGLWPDVTGWTDENNAAIQATFDDVDVPDLTYECRTGHNSVFADLPFTACDGGDGANPTHAPTPTANQEEGGYRTEMRLAHGEWTSTVIGYDFYAHHSLDGVTTCAAPDDDAAIFAAAAAVANFVQMEFPAATRAQAPFIHLPFVNVIRHFNMSDGYPPAFNTGDPFDVDLVSLRRRFALSDDRTLLLIQRRYVSRMHDAKTPSVTTCRNSFRFGVNHSISSSEPREFIDCVNFVLNSRGEGVCIDTSNATPLIVYSDIGWAKLIPRRESFSNKGVDENCVPTADRSCWNWYLETPQ